MVAWATCVVYMSVTCTYVLCVYHLNSVWRGYYGRCTYLAHACTVLVSLHSACCACTPCTVFWHGQHGYVPTYPRLYSYCAYTVAQCVLYLYPLYSDSAWPARAMHLFLPVFVLVLWLYYCTVCTVVVLLHSVYCACTSCTVFWYGLHG